MWKSGVKVIIVIILMCVFLFYVREAADKYLKKATSLANSIVKEEVLKLPLITFCPGIKNEQLRVGTDISGTNEALFTYFDFSENEMASEAEIQDWWNRINFEFEEIFIKVVLGNEMMFTEKVYSSKHERLKDPFPNVTFREINSSFGRCFSFEVLTHLEALKTLHFELNMTQVEAMWFFVHEKYDELGLYLNFWLAEVNAFKISRNKVYDFPMEMHQTTFMKTERFLCNDKGATSSRSKCVFERAQQNFKNWEKSCPTKCSIPQSQLVQDDETSNMPPCTTQVDSNCSREHLYKNVIQRIFLTNSCLKDCTTRKYQIKGREDISNLRISNRTDAYFYWEETHYAEAIEYLIFDFPTIVGTVGGSLGLFLGFSCRGMLNQLCDIIWDLSRKLNT